MASKKTNIKENEKDCYHSSGGYGPGTGGQFDKGTE
jgi:hypothetical protein